MRSEAAGRAVLRGRGADAAPEPGAALLHAGKGHIVGGGTTHGKRYFAVAFGNGGGGYEIRNRFFKGCLPPKDVTLLAYGSASCNLYEGFMDYLSARVLGIGNGEDHLVLNSVSNLTKAYRHLDGYGKLQCHFDNDEAGRRTLEALRTRYGGKVTDCSGLYGGCKDLNDYLQKTLAERQAWRENEKKGKNNGIKRHGGKTKRKEKTTE